MLSKSRDALIIHLFALLHAGLAFGCRALGLTDEIVLTLLTMLLVVIICLRRGMSAKFMAISLILVNIIGFGIAKGISSLLGLLTSEPLVINPISTFITTEIVGWGIFMIAGRLSRDGKFQVTDSSGVRWLLLAFVIVIAVRLTRSRTATGLSALSCREAASTSRFCASSAFSSAWAALSERAAMVAFTRL